MKSKPHITILCSEDRKESEIEEILWGIEEEGLPYLLKFVKNTEVRKENYTSGILEVGIGINSDGSVKLNSRKYDKDYILRCNLDQEKSALRNIGSNSSRLVKGVPFKYIEGNAKLFTT